MEKQTNIKASGEAAEADVNGVRHGESQNAQQNKRARKRRRGKNGEPRTNIYDEVTAKIVRELEAGRFPWAQPWAARGEPATIAAGLPKNAQTGRAYSGINILLLWGAAIDNGFSDQTWLTFKQAKALGGSVMKGERGAMVVYADKFIPRDEQERAAILARLDASEWRGGGPGGDWFNLMCAMHHMTDGAARDEFVAWCAGDPEYAEAGAEVGYRWDSLSREGAGGRPVTAGTLQKLLAERGLGGAWAPGSLALDDDFDDAHADEAGRGVAERPTRAIRVGDGRLAESERGAIVADLLSALSAYYDAGRPEEPPHIGSFEAYTPVRGLLLWCGYDDPAATIDDVKATDHARSESLTALETWNMAFDGEWTTAESVQEFLTDDMADMEVAAGRELHEGREAIVSSLTGGKTNRVWIGRELAKVGGLAAADFYLDIDTRPRLKRFRVLRDGD